MWRRSAQPPSIGSLALQFAATVALLFVVWLLVGGSVGILIAYVAVNLIGVVIQSRDTGNRSRSSLKESGTIGPGSRVGGLSQQAFPCEMPLRQMVDRPRRSQPPCHKPGSAREWWASHVKAGRKVRYPCRLKSVPRACSCAG
jgi:hypothetical protein